MRSSLVVLLISVMPTLVLAQEYSMGDKRIILSSISVQGGFYGYTNVGTLDDFRTLAPESDLLTRDYSEFDLRTEGSDGRNASSFRVLMGFDILTPEKKTYRASPQLKVGIGYYIASALDNSYSSRDLFTIDTTYIDGTTVFINEEHTNFGTFALESNQIRIDGRLMLRSPQNTKLSAYGGVGFSVGHSVQTKVDILLVDRSTREFRSTDGTVLGVDIDSPPLEHETHDAKGHFVSSASLPLGLAYRLSNRSEFLSRIKIFYEATPEVRWTNIPELKSITQSSFHFGGGIEFEI